MNIHTRKRAIFMRSVARRNDSFGADTEGFALSSQRKAQITRRNAVSAQEPKRFALSSQRKLSVLLLVGILILSAKECEMGPGGDKPVTFAYICTNGTKAEGTAKTEGTEKCSACETGFVLSSANECATDSDSDGTADSVDAFPFDDTRTAGICGELSPSVVLETGGQKAANDATGEVYMGEDPRLIAGGTGHRDDPFIIPLSDGCRSINFVWDFTGLTIPETFTDIDFFTDGPYFNVRFTNLPAASTIYVQTTLIDRLGGTTDDGTRLGTIRDTVINRDEPASLRYVVSSIPGRTEPFGIPDPRGQEHELDQNFLDMSYISALSSAGPAIRKPQGRIRFRVLIEPSE